MLISIVLPNLNTNLSYLKECLNSILAQTCTQWECVVIDGFSTNGSWEFLCASLRDDQRFTLIQKPKKGIYNAWNEGIRIAKGEYIYIATSDDTMDAQLLEIMVSELLEHSDCDLAHCCLRVIDERGQLMQGTQWCDYPSARYFGSLIREKHIRYAPHDGILHAFVKTVYHSITQLLIRKDVFELCGFFREDSGSIADYEWGLRVGLSCNVLHIPQYLATWRMHDMQATTRAVQVDPKTYKKLIGWIVSNLEEFNRKRYNSYETHDLEALTHVYRMNQKYYSYMLVLARFRVVRGILRRIIGDYFVCSDGVSEARKYFIEKKVNLLIKRLTA